MAPSILQFGAGNFLRAFADLFVAQANRDPATRVGRIAVVQSTDRHRADALNAAGGRYHVAIQGFADGRVVDAVESVDSIARAFFADAEWTQIRAVARDPALRWIISNTTEAGFALDGRDVARPDSAAPLAPRSFPAKLLDVLLERHAAGQSAPLVVPCELIEQNGRRLRDLVLAQATRWQVSCDEIDWLRDAVRWVDNLVDRIVPGPPARHPLQSADPLLLSAEPYAFWGVQLPAISAAGSDNFLDHPAVTRTTDLAPFYLRKVRILNGAHSALVAHARPRGLATVRECVEHPEIGPWLRRLLFEEIVPAIADRAPDAEAFAHATLERFQNPFLEHALASIALNHEAKVKVRLLPTIEDYRERFGRSPALLAAALGL